MQLTTHRPARAGWYWAEIPGDRPLQPVLVFDGGTGFGLLYTWDAIDDNHDDTDRDGLPVDLSAPSMLWSEAPIPEPAGRAAMTPLQRAAIGLVLAFGGGVLLTLERAEVETRDRVAAAVQLCPGQVDMLAAPQNVQGDRT